MGDSPTLMFEYNALYNAMLHVDLRVENRPLSCLNMLTIRNQTVTTQELSQIMFDRPVAVRKLFWESKFNHTYNWKQIWEQVFILLKDARVRELNWKILHNIYPTNVLLCKMKKVESVLCNWCTETDSIEHFFVYCHKVRPLWTHIESIASAHYNVRIHLSASDIFLGYKTLNQTPQRHTFINALLCIGKLCISKFKYGAQYHPNLVVLFNRECVLRNI